MQAMNTATATDHDIDAARGEPRALVLEPRTIADVLRLRGLSRWMRLAFLLALKAEQGSLTVSLLDGRSFRFSGPKPGPQASVLLRDQRLARRLLTSGNLSFAEAYIDGEVESADLASLVEWVSLNQSVDSALLGRPSYRTLRRLYQYVRGNSRQGSRRNIAYHYDLGNEFYAHWLDPSMTYSSAIFADTTQSLEMAQIAKYQRIAGLLELRREHTLLEVGCGWGGFACYAARSFGCRVTAVTISREQYAYAAERMRDEGLTDLVTIELRDYRDIRGTYDRVVSLEMLEAVGERYWPTYFTKLHSVLRPGGRAALQVITIADRYFAAYRGTMDFIQRYIFPGGMLPSPGALRRETQRAGFRTLDERCFALHYARTLRLWRERFLNAWPEIRNLGFDERFRRLWEYYLCYCEGGFRGDSIDVMQISLVRD
jgi:cyclopropane-fatty-acyl-phospholipid synthase